ncbi:MIT domain-containing protein 1 [Aphelenchoides avenae]|nr:MIT domain-containing protein 1 [Aphelenchus avenae]
MDMNGNGAFHAARPDYSEYVAEMKTYIKQIEKSAHDKKETFKEYLEHHVIDHVTSEEVKKRLRQETNRNVIVPIKPYHSFSIEKGVANYAYDRLFGGCVEGCTRITVEEPYMNEVYYVSNVIHFIEFVVRVNENGGSVGEVLLKTHKTTEDTERALKRVKANAKGYKIDLVVEVTPKFHERHISFHNGWSIILTKGINIYKWTDEFSVGAYDFSKRIAEDDSTLTYRWTGPYPNGVNGAVNGVAHLHGAIGTNGTTAVNGTHHFGRDPFSSPVPRVSPPLSAPPPPDQIRGFDPMQSNIMAGIGSLLNFSLPPPGFEPSRNGGSPPVQGVSPPLAVAQQSASATSVSQYSTPPPPNPFAWSVVASKKAAKVPDATIARANSLSSINNETKSRHTSGGTDVPTRNGIPLNDKGVWLKFGPQCAKWKTCEPNKKGKCKFYHPTKDCDRYPKCPFGAAKCSFAHPFCSEGRPCECRRSQRDAQINHRDAM